VFSAVRFMAGRIAGKLPSHLDYSVEMVGQTGSVGTDTIRAWAGHWMTGYTLPKIKKTTHIVAEYNYATGDKTAGDGKQETFDQLYPTGHDKLGLSDQVAGRTSTMCVPEWNTRRRRNSHEQLLSRVVAPQPNGRPVQRRGQRHRESGQRCRRTLRRQEADIQATYALRPQLSLAGGYANIFPGTFLKNATPGKAYRFSYAMATYQF
jgi:hypothetical protein